MALTSRTAWPWSPFTILMHLARDGKPKISFPLFCASRWKPRAHRDWMCLLSWWGRTYYFPACFYPFDYMRSCFLLCFLVVWSQKITFSSCQYLSSKSSSFFKTRIGITIRSFSTGNKNLWTIVQMVISKSLNLFCHPKILTTLMIAVSSIAGVQGFIVVDLLIDSNSSFIDTITAKVSTNGLGGQG